MSNVRSGRCALPLSVLILSAVVGSSFLPRARGDVGAVHRSRVDVSELREIPFGETVRIGGFAVGHDDRVELVLERFQPVASDATMKIGSRPPVPLVVDADTRFWRGRVAGRSSGVYLAVDATSVRGVIRLADATYVLDGGVASDGSAQVTQQLVTDDSTDCGGTVDPPPEDPVEVEAPLTTPRPGRLRARVAIEMRQALYASFGSTEKARDYAVNLIGASSAIYERDLDVELQLGHLQIYDVSDPAYYTATTSSEFLHQFRRFWESCFPRRPPSEPPSIPCGPYQPEPDATFPRALAITLIATPVVGGGLGRASQETLCSNFGYGYVVADPSLPFSDLLGRGTLPHEIGHVFGSPHSSCYDPPIDHCPDRTREGCYTGPREEPPIVTIMSTCSNRTRPLRFDPREAGLMRSRAESARCVSQVSTVTLPVVQDTYVSSAAPDTGYGASALLQAGRSPSAGKGGAPLIMRTLLHFDLTFAGVGVPPGATVTEAELWLFGTGGQGLPTISVVRLADSFSESGATWRNAPAPASAPEPITERLSTAEGWKMVDVTSHVTDCRTNRGNQCYWRLSEVNETDNTTASFLTARAKESAGDWFARLKITYTY